MPPTIKLTVELGVLVPYPEEGKEAKDQRRPSALRTHTQKLKRYVKLTYNKTLMIDSVYVCLCGMVYDHKISLFGFFLP